MTLDELRARPLVSVEEVLPFFPMSERSFRRALESDGDLAYLTIRVGRRVFVKVAPLLALIGAQDGSSG